MSRSPYCSQHSHGTVIPALPHSNPPNPPPMGAMSGNRPSSVCTSRMACMCFLRNSSTSAMLTAVRENTLMSPLHPIRSLRCGQSVGMLMKFDSIDHRMFCQRRFTIGLLHSKSVVKWSTLLITSPSTSAVGRGWLMPVISMYR